MIDPYPGMGSRMGFNKSVRHVRSVSSVVKQMSAGLHLIDAIANAEKSAPFERGQIPPLLKTVVTERFQYYGEAVNLEKNLKNEDKESISEELSKWGRFHRLIVYHHPQMGTTLADPGKLEDWQNCGELTKHEMLMVYMKAHDVNDQPLEKVAVKSFVDLLMGRKPDGLSRLHGAEPPKPVMEAVVKPSPVVETADSNVDKSAEKPQSGSTVEKTESPPPSGKKHRMTPKYSVQVSNELFHNGNVEAWKNIIESYKSIHPETEVHIFHEGEKVNNINALFKWGKVKHGDVLLFSVSGPDIKGVAKLQRYLYEGASLRYETYLKKDVNKVLTLF